MARKLTITFVIILAIGTAWAFSWRPSTAQDQAIVSEPTNESVEVLARGPVHEAFAEPVNLQGFDPLVIEVAPPEPVEELPPDQKPEGENVEWISGYWAWDEDRKSFIWVSGVWRDIPPGRRWVPGYWSEAEGGWSWTAGFWVSDAAQEIAYLPEPPETLEVGPQIVAPSADHIWVPGVWQYHEARYVWRPGFWMVVQPGWVWVPSRYIWCPNGYVFVNGYWDYPIEERGVLFAPVYYHEPVYRQSTYYYTPTVVISTEILTVHLFASPRYCHYYFGDYYAPRYREIGIEPWLMFPRIRGCYDPLFHYYSWHHRRHGRGDWHRTLRDRYDFFAEHEEYRPAHTYTALRRQRFDRVRTGDINIDNSIQNIVVNQNNLAVNLNQYVQNVDQDVRIDGVRGEGRRRKRFARVDNEERRQFAERARDIRGFQARRSELESQTRLSDRGDRGDRGQFARGDRGQVARGDRGAPRSLSLADFPDRRGSREGAERRDRRDGRGRDRANVAADVPPTPEQTAGGTAGPTNATRDATAGIGRDGRRGRSFERPGRQDIKQQPDATQDATQNAISGRDRARVGETRPDALGRRDLIPGQNEGGKPLRHDDQARDRQRGRDAIGRRGRDRDNRLGLGRVGRDGPQFPGALNQDSDRATTTRTPPGATTPGATMPGATTPSGTPVTDPAAAGTTTNQQLDALRRGRGSRGDRTRRLGDLDATDPSNNTGGLPAARQRGRTSLPGSRNPSGVIRPEATGRALPDGLSGTDAVRNRELRGRGDENRSQSDPFRQRGLDRDAFRSRGQLGGDDTGRNRQAQRQEVFRRQLEQQRGNDERNRSNLEQLLNQRREAARQRDAGSDARGRGRQQLDRGRSGLDFSRGRGNEQSPFGDAGQRDSQARRGSFGPFPGQQGESMGRGQPGAQVPGFDPRSQMQRGAGGRSDNDMRRQFSPGARPSFGGRRGGDDGAEAFQRMNRGGGDADASQQFNRGGGGRSFSRQQDKARQSMGGDERRGRSDGEDQRGGRGGRRGRDRDEDD